MSLPYPHDRARARQDKDTQLYKDAREAMTQKDASIQAAAEAFGEANLTQSEDDLETRLEEGAGDRLRQATASSERAAEDPGDLEPERP